MDGIFLFKTFKGTFAITGVLKKSSLAKERYKCYINGNSDFFH